MLYIKNHKLPCTLILRSCGAHELTSKTNDGFIVCFNEMNFWIKRFLLLVITWARTLKSHFQDRKKKKWRRAASATFVKLVNRAYANHSLPKTASRGNLFGLRALSKTFMFIECLKLIGNDLEVLFGIRMTWSSLKWGQWGAKSCLRAKFFFCPCKMTNLYIAWNLSFNITSPPPPKHHSEHKINHSKYWIHQEKNK